MKKIFAALLSILSTISYAATSDWVPLSDLVEKWTGDPPEMSYGINAMQRCAGLDLAMAELLKEASTEMEQQYMEKALALVQASAISRILLSMERTGVMPDNVEEINNNTNLVIQQMYQRNLDHLNNNYINQGAYFENDINFQSDMTLCDSVYLLANQILEEL
jgi:hypothetical protein